MNNQAAKEAVKQFTGVLTALVPVVGVLGLGFEWFNEEFIRQFEVLALAGLTFVYTCYRIYRNHYATKKGQAQLTPAERAKRGL